ncbi:MAG: hypothetical protein ABWZ25_11505 [Chitinophagaceae bacterium]
MDWEIEVLEATAEDTRNKIEQYSSEIDRLRGIIEGTILQTTEISESLSRFMVGWYGWLARGNAHKRSKHSQIYEGFVVGNVTDTYTTNGLLSK